MHSSSPDPQRTVVLTQNRVSSAALFAGAAVLTIVHNTEDYKLRLTAKGKMILTK